MRQAFLRTRSGARRVWRATALTSAMLVTLAGCGATNPPDPTEPTVSGTISVTLTPASVSVPAGTSGSLGVSITRGGAFAGPVTLTATGVPTGITVSFASPVVSSGAFSTSATITVATGTPAQTASISVTGSGGGSQITSPAVTLTVRVP